MSKNKIKKSTQSDQSSKANEQPKQTLDDVFDLERKETAREFIKKPTEVEVKPSKPPPNENTVEMIAFSNFFRFTTRMDKFLIICGTAGAICAGILTPVLAFVFGNIADTFDPSNSPDSIKDEMKKIAGYVSLIGLGLWIFGYIYYGFWQHLAENISFNLRSRYLHAILKQEIAYFEQQNVEQLPSQIGENFAIIQDAIGEKFSNFIYTITTVIAGLVISYYAGADFATICLAYVPLAFIILLCFGNNIRKSMIQKIVIMKKLGGVIEESLTAIRLITSFAQEEKQIKQFVKLANEVKGVSNRADFFLSWFIGCFRSVIYGFYCYSFWIATYYIKNQKENPNTQEPYSLNNMLTIMVAMMVGMQNIFGINPNVQAIIKAKVVGKFVFDVIDRTPAIQDHEQSVEQFTLDKSIIFDQVTFKYPTAPAKIKNVLEEASFQIKAGQSTAIVGPSGSGKSTIIQMIERFYDPLAGQIYVDSLNLRDIKLKTLRESIGYVSQEPVLILGTIKDNLMFGNKDATEDDIDYALKLANAEFIYELENKLDTYCGSSAVLNLSGGQKQRIAIARALIKRPKILILDEATSALDPKSEREVQGAIDKISNDEASKLTIIMIAHRLQTIMSAQNLLYLEAKNSVVAAVKGTKEYDEIINRLQETNYAHQQNEEKEKENKDEKTKTTQENRIQLEDDTDSVEAEEKSEEKDEPIIEHKHSQPKGVGMMKIMSYYKPQWLTYSAYLITVINGFAFPINGLITAKIIFICLVTNSSTWYEERNFWCGMFLVLCGAAVIIGFLNKYVYAYLGENLTFTLRGKLFESIIYKHLGWFDNKERAPGILSSVLSEDITHINGLSTEVIANLLEAILSILVGIILSFIYNWKIALVCIPTAPFMIVGAVLQSRLQWRFNKQGGAVREKGQQDPYEESNALLSDMLINYRTVISFGEKNIDYVMNRFDKLLEEPNHIGVINAHKSGFLFGYSLCIRFLFLSFIFYVASIFIFNYGDKSDRTFEAVYVVFMAALGSGIALSQAPSVARAKDAAVKVFDIIDDQSEIDPRSTEGETVIKTGKIELKNVDFKYPSRVKKVLNKMNLTIQATKKIALVGHSGCGKSTIANLLLRMYDIADGQLLIDGVDIRKYNIRELRRQIGIVMQEPLLFNTSIKENILYGNEDASDQRVREVAEMANALAFIESNIEDLDKDEVKEKIEAQFREFINKPEILLKYPDYQQLLHKYFDSRAFTITEVQVILEILEKGDSYLRNLINFNIERFSTIIKDVSNFKGLKWDDIVLRFEWSFVADEITVYINESKIFKPQQRQTIQNYMHSHQTKFDLETIQELEKLVQFMERPEQNIDEIIKKLIRESFERIKVKNNERIKSLHFQNTNDKDFKLHEGFNKSCGLKGSMLSGGQKQRIAIARALIKDPKILILDEATSALDELSQELVQQALDRAMEGRTSVVIAHRLSTIRNCELLFVIHNGVVVEQGTYDELSANTNSYFYKLKSGMEM